MIIETLTELYGTPINGRNGFKRWIVSGKDGFEVSIMHSDFHMCDDSSAEIAIVRGGKIVDPHDAINDQYVLHLFTEGKVAPNCDKYEIRDIVFAIQ